MLTADTKRKIDYLRDVLVGKIPVPSQQIEQITLGLIYKFMSDIDEQNEELGGKSFFSGEYKKYSWKNIMDRSLAGHERVLFYAEGLEKMSRNDKLPQLFRDIFKGAFLPFKDPAVLDLFLKGINEFKYEHSEELGNAFEYLLSTAASQGDAGQFRTPRHIIDFIVEVVDPQKEDKILDPACGTAGFLVSAYKHILRNNTDKKSGRPGSLLTSSERKKLTKNIVGYDISHEMVRLSLVNLYLHGFAEPNIYEYDTLSSLEHWDDNFDCLLANPPFMTPRGGIKPHNRFPIQAKRSEVLFVDYITEHLTPNGKAGIIVPEGIIFQSGSAYKQLRKMLVEDGLWAVVSLPQGVFNPYAGVKTNILFFNNTIARQTKEILFTKVENDGYDLGAQRRPIDQNDLSSRLELLKKYRKLVQENKKFSLSKDEEVFASVVRKEKIAKDGEYNLIADRYVDQNRNTNNKYGSCKLKDLIEETSDRANKEKFNVWSVSNTSGFVASELYFDKKVASVDTKNYKVVGENYFTYNPSRINVGSIALNERKNIGVVSPMYVVFKIKDKGVVSPRFLLALLKSAYAKKLIEQRAVGAVRKQLRFKDLSNFEIPLPPLEDQEKIVGELENYQKIIDCAEQIIESYKPTIKIDPKWQIKKLGDIAETITKGTTPTTVGHRFEENGVNFIKVESISENGKIDFKKLSFISSKCQKALKRSQLKANDILFSIAGTEMGISALVSRDILPANTNQALAIIRLKNDVDANYILNYLRSTDIKTQIENIKVGVAQFNLSLKQVSELEIPFPPYEIQKAIVEKIEEEQKMIGTNKELIELFKQKIKDKISEVWGE